MVELNNVEKVIVRFCKNKYGNYPNFVEDFKPFFEKMYGYDPESHLVDYKKTIHRKLFDLVFKLYEDHTDMKRIMFEHVQYALGQDNIYMRGEQISNFDACIINLRGHIMCAPVKNSDGSFLVDLEIDDEFYKFKTMAQKATEWWNNLSEIEQNNYFELYVNEAFTYSDPPESIEDLTEDDYLEMFLRF